MNEFERGINKAKTRQHRRYVFAILFVFFAGMVIVGVLVSASGTSVKVQPLEAEKSGTISVVSGYAFTFENVVYGFSDASTISVRAVGFREQHRIIRPAERGGTINITMIAIPGRLEASTNPAHSKTRWIVDGNIVAIGKTLSRELEPRKYALQIDNPYFNVVNRELEINRAKTLEISAELKPINGQLSVSSIPPNAAISIDKQMMGRTPITIKIEGGEHKILVEKEGYVSVEDQLALTNTEFSAERAYRLKHVSSTLAFNVQPSGGQLLLNGRKIDPSKIYKVNSNTKHTITYIRDGFHSLAQKITLKAKEKKQINIRLKPELGDVEIYGEPSADIYVDGKKLGNKFLGLSLSAVVHEIEFRKTGYRTVKKTLKPSSNHKTVVRESLISELIARKSEAPREYKNSAEIELKLFEPGPIVMGAPRHQKGQRANEFERNVVLKLPFYAGKHEVTNAQFAKFENSRSGSKDEPVTSVSWMDAVAFCNWLSKNEGLLPFYEILNQKLMAVNKIADGYRLLTEAEWEWLARKAGKKNQTVFPWGNDDVVPSMAGNIADESANGLTKFYVPNYNDGYAGGAPVGRFPAEKSGLFDITGNVSEWVHDFYSLSPPNRNITYLDPLGPKSGESHVVKGANWRSGTRTLLRAAYRNGLANRKDDVGFRIGRYLYGKEAANSN